MNIKHATFLKGNRNSVIVLALQEQEQQIIGIKRIYRF